GIPLLAALRAEGNLADTRRGKPGAGNGRKPHVGIGERHLRLMYGACDRALHHRRPTGSRVLAGDQAYYVLVSHDGRKAEPDDQRSEERRAGEDYRLQFQKGGTGNFALTAEQCRTYT